MTGPARLHGRSLRLARLAWLVLATSMLLPAVVGLGRAFESPSLVALPALDDLFGVEFDVRLALLLVPVPSLVITLLVCAVVFWRRSDDPLALVVTMSLLALYIFASRTLLTLDDLPVLRHSLQLTFVIGMVAFTTVLARFPDGRVVPRSARWLPPAMAALVLAVPSGGRWLIALLDGELAGTIGQRSFVVVWAGLVLAGLVAQARRYRSVSTTVQRQQTKWAMAPVALQFVLFTPTAVAVAVLPAVDRRWLGLALVPMVLLGLLAPIMVANAVLRHRLHDIDRILSRTIAYLLLLLVLGSLYVLGVLVVGALVIEVAGVGNELVVAATTLGVVAVSRPLQRRVRRAVDRRFDRASYDAERTLTAFGHRVRDEVDLDALTADLLTVVEEAVNPAHATLWNPGHETSRRSAASGHREKIEQR
jgi:hypothetical protein